MNIIVKAKNAVLHNPLIGNTVFDDTEYEELLKITRTCSNDFLKDGSCLHIKKERLIVFTTLLETAKRWKKFNDDENDESGFWEYVIKTILSLKKGNSGFNKLRNAYTDVIKIIETEHKIISAKKGKKYYATLMLHALAPTKSIYAFLDLSYNIFRKDLNFSYTDNDKDICEMVTVRFCEILEKSVGNDKSISIGTNSYSIKVGLRTLALSNETQKYFCNLLHEALKNINHLFHENSINCNNYFDNLATEWWHDKQALIGIDKKSNYRFPAVHKSKINVRFIRFDKAVYIIIPPIRVEDAVNNTFHLTVYTKNNHEPLISGDLFTTRGEFFDSTKQKNIDLNELLQANQNIYFRIMIRENDGILFEATIEKDFLLFENEHEISSNIIPASNYFLYSTNINSLERPENISTYAANLYNIYPRAGESIIGANRKIYFQNKAGITANKNNISLTGNLLSCYWLFGNNIYTVFNDEAIISIPKDSKIEEMELHIAENRYLLSEFQKYSNTDYLFFNITRYLEMNKPTNILLYLEKNKILELSVVYFQGLNLSFSRTVFYGNDDKRLTVLYNGKSDELYWNNKENELLHPLHNGNLIIEIPYIKWRIDNKEWHNEPVTRKLWYKDYFHNSSFLQINSDIKIARVFIENHYEIIMPNKTNHNFDIGNFIFSNEGIKNITFTFPAIEDSRSLPQEKNKLFTVSTEEHFYKNPFIYADGKLNWRASESFVGDEKRQFKVEIFRDTNKLVYFGELSFMENETIDIKDGLYKIKISSKDNSVFKSGEKIFYESEIIIGSYEKYRFSNKNIELIAGSTELDKDEDIDLFWRNFNPKYLIDQIEYITQGKDNFYLGYLYTIRPDGAKIYLNSLRNEKGEWEKINPLRIDFVTNFELEIKAGYDTENDDFLGALIYDKVKRSICNNNVPAAKKNRFCCLNRYKFCEVNNV